MKIMFKVFSLFIVFSLSAEELELGAALPLADVKMTDISGENISLNDAKGDSGLLVIFTCNTWPWVIAWEDRYVELANVYKSKGVGMIAVNSNEKQFDSVESMEEMKIHAEEKGYNFYYTMDPGSNLAYKFGATRTPHVFLFNNKDKLVYRGAIDDNARKPKKIENTYLADAIDNMLIGETIDPASTKALGCSIKFKN